MTFASHMNRYETCLICGGPVPNGMPCTCKVVGREAPYSIPPTIPVPQSRRHAEMMILVAERYLSEKTE